MKKEDSKKNQNPVINPPDIAIALAYDGESAPKVLAKGQGNVADKIIEMAEENDIVIVAGKGHEDYQLFADKTIHFSDEEVIKEAIKQNV